MGNCKSKHALPIVGGPSQAPRALQEDPQVTSEPPIEPQVISEPPSEGEDETAVVLAPSPPSAAPALPPPRQEEQGHIFQQEEPPALLPPQEQDHIFQEPPASHEQAPTQERPTQQAYGVIVVGGGPMGLAAAYECAKAGKKVLLLERFVLYNQNGSSNDLCRMYRTMYTEDYMADLAYNAMGAWERLEKDAGTELILRSGLLNFGDPNYKSGPEGNLSAPIKNLERLGMEYEKLTVDEIQEQFPFRNLPSNFEGLWAPDNGCINVPEMLRQLVRLCKDHGVEIVQWAKVHKLDTSREFEVKVFATVGEEECIEKYETFVGSKCCIVAAGAYTNQILDPSFDFRLDLDIWEMAYEYYACDSTEEYPANPGAPANTLQSKKGSPFKSMWFQFMENEDGDPEKSNLFYGFPAVPWGIKDNARIAVDHAARRIRDPSERNIGPNTFDLQRTQDFVDKHLKGVLLQPNFAGNCLQTNVYDNMFVMDYLPPTIQNHKNVAIFTAGWGMKFVPLIGVILKQLVLDGGCDPLYDISNFKITRSDSTGSVIAKPSSPSDAPSAFRNSFKGSSQRVTSTPSTTARASDSKKPFSRAAYGQKLAPSLRLKANVDRVTMRGAGDEAPLSIGIIGGGISGLYAALLLKDIGLNAKIEILEANPKRLGGRIFTKYFGTAKDAKPGTPEYYNFFDVGAMCFPKIPIHDRVIVEQKWSLVNYLNSKDKYLNKNLYQRINLKPYTFNDDNNLMYYNSILEKSGRVHGPDPFSFNAMPGGEKLSYDTLLDLAIGDLKAALRTDFNTGFEELMRVDGMSVRAYLQSFLKQTGKSEITFQGKYSDRVIDMIETLDSSSDMYNRASITETVIDAFDFDYKKEQRWCHVDGGSSRLIDGMEAILKNEHDMEVTKGARVKKLSLCDNDQMIQTELVQTVYKRVEIEITKSYDHVISTLPFSVFRTLDTSHLKLSNAKREAMRVLNYDNSCKVAICFAKRWWQDTSKKNPVINGGQSSTDLPSRTIVYPSYGDENSPGVLIASYTWTQDADRMSALSKERRVEICLRDLASLHGEFVHKEEILDSYSHSWYQDEYTQGAFALFGPAQFSTHFQGCVEKAGNGRLHFAGEATSVHHAWVVGALNSAYRTVAEILMTLPDGKRHWYLTKLRENWGTVDEIEIDEPGL